MRPIVLLTTLRKNPLAVLSRIAPKVEECMSNLDSDVSAVWLMYCSDTGCSVLKCNVSEYRSNSFPQRQTTQHSTDIPRRLRIADDSPTAHRYYTRTTTFNRRLPCIRDIYQTARSQSQPSIISCLSRSSSARPSVAPSATPLSRCQLTVRS